MKVDKDKVFHHLETQLAVLKEALQLNQVKEDLQQAKNTVKDKVLLFLKVLLKFNSLQMEVHLIPVHKRVLLPHQVRMKQEAAKLIMKDHNYNLELYGVLEHLQIQEVNLNQEIKVLKIILLIVLKTMDLK
jgi:hypothetical protein